jgi:hypothetical protein
MSDITTEKINRRREMRPERISLGDQDAVRNDVLAKEQGVSERTLNREDKDDAPYMYFGGVKYRPERDYRAFLVSRIKHKKPAAKKRAAS